MKELISALEAKKNSAPGGDSITYEIINETPLTFKQKILEMFNHIWMTGNIPQTFKHAIIIPIFKSGKDKQTPSSYRPISLTSHMGKLLETIINKRLNYHLEENNLLNQKQAGFRKNRQTLDQLLALENAIQTSKINGKVLGAIFLDLEKAYDTMWRGGVLKNLKEMKIKGKMYNYIQSFIKDRTFQVKVGNELSEVKEQLNGTPQGAVISPTLFNIAINKLGEQIKDNNTTLSQFADDCGIWKNLGKGKLDNKNKALKILTEEANNLISFLEQNGFKVNIDKTQIIFFGSKEKDSICLGNREVKTVKKVKFLGMTLGKNNNYKDHIDEKCTKARKSLGLLRTLAHPGLNVPYFTKKVIYRNIIEPSLTYGQELYMTAPKTYLDKLDSIQGAALRLMSNVTCCTSTAALQVANNIEPLSLRREAALLKYWVRCKFNTNNPTNEVFRDAITQTSQGKFKKSNTKNHSTAWIAKSLTEEYNIKIQDLKTNSNSVAPWCLPEIKVDTSLTICIHKKETLPPVAKTKALEHIEQTYQNYQKLYTDGSKKDNYVGTGIHSKDFSTEQGIRIQNQTSILTAELYAILTAVDIVEKSEIKNNKIVILTDSLSAAKSLDRPSIKQARSDLIQNILTKAGVIKERYKTTITVCWIPAHCDISGNDIADELAKKSLNQDTAVQIKLGKSELYSQINKVIRDKWQSQWNTNKSGATFREIAPKIGNHKMDFNQTNKYINRVRLGGTFFKITKPKCAHCNQTTTEHILLKCQAHEPIKNICKSMHLPFSV